ncbi:MAG: tetratricopeptide repeat protein [Fimbriimonadaceae bacterium]|nr:tetratricopeptide repeat protein [Fimbriimonadaceae bacterium]
MVCLLLGSLTALAPPAPGPLAFRVVADQQPGPRLVSLSLPLGPGEATSAAGASVRLGTTTSTAQVRALNRHPDGSLRRVLLRLPWEAGAGASAEGSVSFTATAPSGPPIATDDGRGIVLQAAGRTIRSTARGARIETAGGSPVELELLAPLFPQRHVGPAVHLIENGPHFAWVELVWYSNPWQVRAELTLDRYGALSITARVRLLSGGQADPPAFGLRLTGLALPTGPAVPSAGTVTAGPREWTCGPQRLLLPDGPQIRQGRWAWAAAAAGAAWTLTRDASLDSTVDAAALRFYEGQERAVSVLLPPPGQAPRTCRVDVASRRRCAAVLGQPLVDWGPLTALRATLNADAAKLSCRDGDQFGDFTSAVDPVAPRWSLQGLTRIDTGADLLRDYYRGGDAVLRDRLVEWAENWVSLKQYRGGDLNSYGGERYTVAAWQSIPSFNQKGIALVAYAYEETGDPRYLDSVRAWGSRLLRQTSSRGFVSTSVVSPATMHYDINVRPAFLARDLVFLARWTGDGAYLDAARTVIRAMDSLDPAADGLLREGYGDPFSPFYRLVTGTDLGITQDNSDHHKPFILQYCLDGAQALFEATGDPVAERWLRRLSDFQLAARQPGGIWNYAQRHAGVGNSIGHMTVEMSNGLLRSAELTGDARYRDAALDSLHLVTALLQRYGRLLDGVHPPLDRAWFYPDDRCELDFYRGRVSLAIVGRDLYAYLLDALDRALRVDPQAASKLTAPVTDPRQQWLVDQVPLAGSGTDHEFGHCWIAKLVFPFDGDSESGGKSDLVLLEDGRVLGPPHSLHAAIREQGGGRYSHWTRGTLYFSASDNSDPTANGRGYAWFRGKPEQVPPRARWSVLPLAGPYPGRRPHPCVALYEKGLAAEREQRWLDAVAVWDEVLRRWPATAPELYRQIELYRAAGDLPGAVAVCQRFVTTFPQHQRAAEVRLRQAALLLTLNRRDEAREAYDATVQAHAGSPWAEEALARRWAELGLGSAPPLSVVAARDAAPAVTWPVLEAATGEPSPAPLRLAAQHDGTTLTLTATLGGGALPAGGYEGLYLYLDPRGQLTDYLTFGLGSDGTAVDRPLLWHLRSTPPQKASGWTATATPSADGWTATFAIPFARLGYTPAAGQQTLRLALRWDSRSGPRLPRPTNPEVPRPIDGGWLVVRP